MRALFWLLALAALAIGIAMLGRISDGYVLWVIPPWRVELSFNLFVVTQLIVLVLAYLLLRAVFITLNLPGVVAAYRARRARQRDEQFSAEALRYFWEGRYAQSLKSAEKVGAGGTAVAGSAANTGTARGIAALVGLKAAHALRDPARIATWQARAADLDASGWGAARLMAEMRIALDARDFPAAREALEQLGAKERRQISAQRLALRLAQGEADWPELLRLVRMLEKHDALTAEQARPLRLRAQRGMIEALQDDPAQLMKHWQTMTTADRSDPQIVLRAVRAFTAAGACQESAQLIEDHLDDHWEPALLDDYAGCPGGDVLRRIAHCEKWLLEHPQEAGLLLALGRLCARQQLWGKAQSYLEASLAIRATRIAHVELAQLLDRLEKSALAERHYRAAALL
jgi:HemY protein